MPRAVLRRAHSSPSIAPPPQTPSFSPQPPARAQEDSCNAASDHETAFAEYALMRDGLNATGRPIFFSLCGWNAWYAAVGGALGNSARIGQDDSNWGGILVNIDDMAPLWPYSGPGYANDPCLLLGAASDGSQTVTELQSRAQFSMWAVLRAPLLLSQSVVNMTASRLATYSNAEVIGVSRDTLGRQGLRLKGGALSAERRGLTAHRAPATAAAAAERRRAAKYAPWTLPTTDVAVTLQPCAAPPSAAQAWAWNASGPGFLSNPGSGACMNVNDCGSQLIAYDCVTTGGTCAGPASYANEVFSLGADGTLRSALAPASCAAGAGVGSTVQLGPCTGAPSQQFAWDAPSQQLRAGGGLCVTVGGPVDAANVWGRPLQGGAWALAFLNAGSDAADVACDYASCLSGVGWEAGQVVSVRDLWAHAELGNFTAGDGFNATALPAAGGVALLRMTPVWGAAP